MRSTSILVALLLAGVILPAQQLVATVSPNPAPPGAVVTLSVLARPPAGLFTPGGCLYSNVRQGTPSGPSVALIACTLLPTPIPSCGSGAPFRTATWNQQGLGGQVPPGDYWFGVAYATTPFGPTTVEWIGLRIEDAVPGPSLSGPPAALQGTLFLMSLSAPARPLAGYVAALSGSSNTGVASAIPVFIGLDPDLLFFLSLDPAHASIFPGFQGVLDAGGGASLAVAIPTDPALSCFPFRVQALVFPMQGMPGMLETSNVLSTYVQ